jgi:hypothetical protein
LKNDLDTEKLKKIKEKALKDGPSAKIPKDQKDKMKDWLNKEVKDGKVKKEFEEFKDKVTP